MAQALVGRLGGERERARRRRGGLRRPPRGHRGGRGHEGGFRRPGAVRRRHDRARPQGRRAGGGRPSRGPGLHGALHAPAGGVSAVHGALHAQRHRRDRPRARRMGRMRARTVRDRGRVELAPLPRHVPAWRHAGGGEPVIVPWTAMIQSTQSFGHYR